MTPVNQGIRMTGLGKTKPFHGTFELVFELVLGSLAHGAVFLGGWPMMFTNTPTLRRRVVVVVVVVIAIAIAVAGSSAVVVWHPAERVLRWRCCCVATLLMLRVLEKLFDRLWCFF